MLMMRVPAVRIMRSWPRAEAASSNLLALHRAVQKPAPTPHGTRARFAAIHQLISNFRVRVGDPAGARITSISGTPATRRRRVGGNGWPPLKGFAFTGFAKLRRSVAAPTEGLLCWSTHALEACKDFLSKAVSAACFFVFAPCCEALLPGSGFLGCGLLGSTGFRSVMGSGCRGKGSGFLGFWVTGLWASGSGQFRVGFWFACFWGLRV